MSASVITTGAIGYGSFVLFAVGLVVPAVVLGVLTLILLLGVAGLLHRSADRGKAAEIAPSLLQRSLRTVGGFCLFVWLITQPEFDSLIHRLFHERGLLDARIVVGIGAYAVLITISLLREVSRLSDASIYAFLIRADELPSVDDSSPKPR
jgi:hypothetical protein